MSQRRALPSEPREGALTARMRDAFVAAEVAALRRCFCQCEYLVFTGIERRKASLIVLADIQSAGD